MTRRKLVPGDLAPGWKVRDILVSTFSGRVELQQRGNIITLRSEHVSDLIDTLASARDAAEGKCTVAVGGGVVPIKPAPVIVEDFLDGLEGEEES